VAGEKIDIETFSERRAAELTKELQSAGLTVTVKAEQ